MTYRRLDGKRLARARALSGISQEKLAEQVGFERHTSIWKLERDMGDPPSSRVAAIADALAVSVDWLFGEGPDDPAAAAADQVLVGKLALLPTADRALVESDIDARLERARKLGRRAIPTQRAAETAAEYTTDDEQRAASQ